MPKPTKGPRLGAGPAHQRKLLAGLAKSLIEHKAITTTEAKARRLRPYVEKLITKALRGDIHNRRMVSRKLGTQVSKTQRGNDAVYTLFDVIAPQIDPARKGGYTRIVKLPARRGDNAPLAQISLVLEKVTPKAKLVEDDKPAKDQAEADLQDKEAVDTAADSDADAESARDAEAADDADVAQSDEDEVAEKVEA